MAKLFMKVLALLEHNKPEGKNSVLLPDGTLTSHQNLLVTQLANRLIKSRDATLEIG